MAEGIEVRHTASCRSRDTGRCNCKPSYRAKVWSHRDNRAVKKTFDSIAAAKAWRHDAQTALKDGSLRAPVPTTIREAADDWLEGARAGRIRTRSGDEYKPASIRSYDDSLERRVLPVFGSVRLADLRRVDVQEFVDRLVGQGLSPSTVQTALLPLQAIYRRALARGLVAVNPTTGLEKPAVRSRRDRFADPAEAAQLIAALAPADRPVWATAMYAGLRRGEIMALRWGAVDLAGGVIRVDAGWDVKEGRIETKGRTKRKVPIPVALRDFLVEHRQRSMGAVGELDPQSLVFGRTPTQAFRPEALAERAKAAWKDAGLQPIGLHECRHTFASLMIAAGVNPKALCDFMGHSSIKVTFDKYGHLMPGNEAEAAGLLDAYLERANTQARMAQLEDASTV